MTANYDEGYRDGREGRNNAMRSPNYIEGWQAGWRDRALAWKAMTDAELQSRIAGEKLTNLLAT